ncbi:biotin synthase [Desulfotomaculum arcticum]|uniref:biotin synthase n=2 Tax=Desulfotruncus TaxID=2867377 RepID=A0A1I2U7W9_9FIRM|nr:biotin synthase [Desulfotomaculum arcticum] [Desulfotruncus arcticus DSM 17038]
MIKMSAGTAHVLGFKQLSIDALPTTAYLMSGEKCAHDCAFCPQARNASAKTNLLSRVTWSEGSLREIAAAIGQAYSQGLLQRACLQVVDGDNVLAGVKEAVGQIKACSRIPVSVSVRLTKPEEVLVLAGSGVDRIGLALDAAAETAFKSVKTGGWQQTLSIIKEAARLLPGRISTHLIAGLGETEQEMVTMMQHMHDLGVTVGLFAFTPVPGTKMARHAPPGLAGYRRLQAANYLIGKKIVNAQNFIFNSGKLIYYGLAEAELRAYLINGRAFQTSGCPGCNRPYYNEKPGGTIYNYPRPLTAAEAAAALEGVLNG